MSLIGEEENLTPIQKCHICKVGVIQEHPNFLCCSNTECRFLYIKNNKYGEKLDSWYSPGMKKAISRRKNY